MKSLSSALRLVRGYFWFAFALFFLAIFFGFSSDAFHDVLDQQLMELGELAGELSESEDPNLTSFIFIFLNNAIKSIAVMYAGLLLGILPLFFILINGMLIGYLLNVFQDNSMYIDFTITELVVKGLLPHGIIEIPIILVAAAYGLLLGVAVLRKITSLFRRDDAIAIADARNDRSVKFLLKSSKHLVWFIILSLLIAAWIEAYITPKLLAL